MMSHEENELLCRVEGDAPMGQLMLLHAAFNSFDEIQNISIRFLIASLYQQCPLPTALDRSFFA